MFNRSFIVSIFSSLLPAPSSSLPIVILSEAKDLFLSSDFSLKTIDYT